MHLASNTGRHVRSGEDIRYTRMAIELFEPYLPEEHARRITRTARRTYAVSALRMARAMLATGDVRGAAAQCREALWCCVAPRGDYHSSAA